MSITSDDKRLHFAKRCYIIHILFAQVNSQCLLLLFINMRNFNKNMLYTVPWTTKTVVFVVHDCTSR